MSLNNRRSAVKARQLANGGESNSKHVTNSGGWAAQQGDMSRMGRVELVPGVWLGQLMDAGTWLAGIGTH